MSKPKAAEAAGGRPTKSAGAELLALIALLLLPALAATSQEDTVDEPPPIEILEPRAGEALFGERRIRVALHSDGPPARVEIRFDDRTVASLTEPPWIATVDAGQENRDHRIEVVLTAADGTRTATTRIAPAVRVDESLDLGLRQVYVTATRRGERVLDLEASEVELLDDGVPQEIVTFESGDIPFTAVVVVDGSLSMRGPNLRAALLGVREFVRSMEEFDEARVVVVSHLLRRASPFVGPSGELLASLGPLEGAGGTTVHDALFLGLRELESRQGRRVVILLSDGKDTHSILRMADVRRTARSSRSQLYWIRLDSLGDLVPRTAWRTPEQAHEDLDQLRETVEETGGRTLDVRGIQDVGSALGDVLAELRSQVAIGYYPTPPGEAGRLRTVELRVDRRGVDLRYRAGYRKR